MLVAVLVLCIKAVLCRLVVTAVVVQAVQMQMELLEQQI
jgi:hypothetical protein